MEENKNNMNKAEPIDSTKETLLNDEDLKNVSGGSGDISYRTRYYVITHADDKCNHSISASYKCESCGCNARHLPRCTVREEDRNRCKSCVYFEKMSEEEGVCTMVRLTNGDGSETP